MQKNKLKNTKYLIDIDVDHIDKMNLTISKENQILTFHDVELVVNEVNYPVLKYILSSNTPYFR